MKRGSNTYLLRMRHSGRWVRGRTKQAQLQTSSSKITHKTRNGVFSLSPPFQQNKWPLSKSTGGKCTNSNERISDFIDLKLVSNWHKPNANNPQTRLKIKNRRPTIEEPTHLKTIERAENTEKHWQKIKQLNSASKIGLKLEWIGCIK